MYRSELSRSARFEEPDTGFTLVPCLNIWANGRQQAGRQEGNGVFTLMRNKEVKSGGTRTFNIVLPVAMMIIHGVICIFE